MICINVLTCALGCFRFKARLQTADQVFLVPRASNSLNASSILLGSFLDATLDSKLSTFSPPPVLLCFHAGTRAREPREPRKDNDSGSVMRNGLFADRPLPRNPTHNWRSCTTSRVPRQPSLSPRTDSLNLLRGFLLSLLIIGMRRRWWR